MRLLSATGLALGTIGALATLVFPFLLGFNALDFAIDGAATAALFSAHALALRGRLRASSTVLLIALLSAIWPFMLTSASAPDYEVFVFLNLLPTLVAFALGRPLMAAANSIATILFVLVRGQVMRQPIGDEITLVIAVVALATMAALASVLRNKESRRATEAEIGLGAAEQEYRALFENMQEGFAHCRMVFKGGKPVDFDFLRVSPSFDPLTGLHDVTGKRVTQVLPGLRRSNPGLFDMYGRIARGGAAEHLEIHVPELQRWFRVYAHGAGRGEFVAIFDNITASKEAEETLRRSEQRLREAEAIAHLGAWEFDVASAQLTLSDEGLRLFGLEGKHIISFRTFLDLVHVEDRPRVQATLTAALARRLPHAFGFRLVPPAGGLRTIRAIGPAPTFVDGKATRLTGTLQDVTAEREAEDRRLALEATNREVVRLEELNRMRIEFLNTAAHDLKTPLTPLKLQLATLRIKGGLDPSQKANLEIMDRNLSRFQVLVDDMLDAARLQSGRLKLRRERTLLGPLVQEAVDSFEEPARQGGLVLVCAPLPDAAIDADPSKVEQVLMNLVSNAVKYTPHGGKVGVRVTVDGKEAVVAVQDTGLGMTPEQMGKLFQPFVRLHEGQPDVAKGTGLGLYICKGIVEQHGGRIWAETDGPGKGSTFSVSWPLATAATPLPHAHASTAP